MSLGGGASTALDDAVAQLDRRRRHLRVAAGNSNANACNSSPARVSQALTVGARRSTDARSSFSNFGTCVDLFAPGSSITSAWNTSNTATNTISGTSMATPHVAGAAALYLAGQSVGVRRATVHAAVVDNASVNKLSSVGSGSPNRLLLLDFRRRAGGRAAGGQLHRSRAPGGPARLTQRVNRRSRHQPAMPGTSETARRLRRAVAHTYASNGTFTVRLTVTDTAGQTDTESRSVTVSAGGAPLHGLPGVHRHAVGHRRLRLPPERQLVLQRRIGRASRLAPGAVKRRLRSLPAEMERLFVGHRRAVGKLDLRGADCLHRDGGLLPLACLSFRAAEAIRSGCSDRDDRCVVYVSTRRGSRVLIAQVTPAVLLVVTVAQGAMSNIEEPRQVVVRTAAEWQALWKEHSPETALPAVDFAQSTVVGVFLGSRPNSGVCRGNHSCEGGGRSHGSRISRASSAARRVGRRILTFPFQVVR